MNPVMRLGGAAIVAVLAAGVLFLALQPTSSVGPPATGSPPPAASVTPTIELPTARQLAPTAVIDLAGMVSNTIPLTTDGTDLWVGVDGAVIRIDGQTNATKRMDLPEMSTGNGEIAIAPDGLWIARYNSNRVERVDPATGKVLGGLDASVPRNLWFVDDQLWLGASGVPGAYLVDRKKLALGPRIGNGNFFAVGDGDVWIGGGLQASDVVTRYDAVTGAVSGTLSVPLGTGCAVTGVFPDNVWAACPPWWGGEFGTCPANLTAVRIDPATNSVVATAKICGSPVAVIDGTPWFLAGRKEGPDIANSLVSADPATGRLLTQLDLGKIDPDVIVLTDAALWMSDEEGDRIVRYDLTELRG